MQLNRPDRPCPLCGISGSLSIAGEFIPKTVGSFSLAGGTPKLVVELRPVLSCDDCGGKWVGRVETDENGKPYLVLPIPEGV